MTVNEFKDKYPHYAHLEGDELWDMMTNVAFSEGSIYTADPEREIFYNSYEVEGVGTVQIEDDSKTVWINEKGEKGLILEKSAPTNTTTESYSMQIIDFSNLPETKPYDLYAGLSAEEKIDKMIKDKRIEDSWKNCSPYDK